MGLIFWLSSRSQPGLLREAPDHVLHFVAYFVLAVLAVRAFSRGLLEPARHPSFIFGLVVSFLYALTDEWHQSFVPGRVASGWDLFADGLGILSALAVLLLFWHRAKRTTSLLPED
jgi:VanZ family protein